MRRFHKLITILVMAVSMAACLCACGANAPVEAPSPAVESAPVEHSPTMAPTQAPTLAPETPVPDTLPLPQAVDGWAESYIAFLDSSYDIFAALWPEGISGMGFIDLDLDGTPELVVFDQGASSTLGVQLFDLIDGQVQCVSSVLDSAAGAFGSSYFSSVSVCANFFESFRLSKTADGWCFWVDSANSTMETAWDDIIRFDGVNGVLTPSAVCSRYLQTDPTSGLVTAEQYTVGGAAVDGAAYQAAANVYLESEDVSYNGAGVFLWNNLDVYSVPYEGFMAMARDAAAAYVPIASVVTRVSAAG